MLPDNIVRQRLAFIRYLYGLAIEQSQHPQPQQAASVLTFHDSVELFLHLAAEHRGAPVRRDTKFLDYWDILQKVSLPCDLGHRVSMSRLNEARVSLKHRGITPSAGSIAEFRDVAAAFFEESTRLVFDIDFSSVSLIDLVASPEVRSLLGMATQSLESGNVIDTVENAAVAFAELIDNYERGYRSMFGVHPFDSPIVFRSSLFAIPDHAVREFASDIQEVVENLRTVTKILALGLDYHHYAKFRGFTPAIALVIGGGFVLMERDYEPVPTVADARYCCDFVIDSALKLQETAVPLLSPERPRAPLQRQPRAYVRAEITRPKAPGPR